MTEKLRKKYTIKKDSKQYATISKLVTNEFYDSKWAVPANSEDFKASILTINDKKINGTTFINFIDKQQKSGLGVKPINKAVDVLFDRFENEQLSNYYDENLEKEFPEFANVMEEYRDGLLLFDLMEKEIWERAKTDTTGLQNFYNTRKYNYMWKKRIDATVISSTKMEFVKKAQSMMKKDVAAKDIKEKLNTNDVVNVMSNNGVFEDGSEALPKSIVYNKEGVSDIVKEGEYYFVVKVDKILPEGLKTLEECKGKAINDYQQYLEQRWVDDLKQEYNVKIDKNVFEHVKSQIKP